ncbi:MAG: hypothetical protein ACFCVA_13995 [Gammaproteobacteria bacterium]
MDQFDVRRVFALDAVQINDVSPFSAGCFICVAEQEARALRRWQRGEKGVVEGVMRGCRE